MGNNAVRKGAEILFNSLEFKALWDADLLEHQRVLKSQMIDSDHSRVFLDRLGYWDSERGVSVTVSYHTNYKDNMHLQSLGRMLLLSVVLKILNVAHSLI